MKEAVFAFLGGNSGRRLEVATAVVVIRGKLAGARGVLIGFRGEHHCLIELDIAQKGVTLMIDRAAVKERPTGKINECEQVPVAEICGNQ